MVMTAIDNFAEKAEKLVFASPLPAPFAHGASPPDISLVFAAFALPSYRTFFTS